MPSDRPWTDADRELVAGLVRALPPPPRLPGEVGSLGPSPDEFAAAVLDALTAAGWRPATPEQQAREDLPTGFASRHHRHFGSGAIHRDDGPECDMTTNPKRVYVFDEDALDEHERHIIARTSYAIGERCTREQHGKSIDYQLGLHRAREIARALATTLPVSTELAPDWPGSLADQQRLHLDPRDG